MRDQLATKFCIIYFFILFFYSPKNSFVFSLFSRRFQPTFLFRLVSLFFSRRCASGPQPQKLFWQSIHHMKGLYVRSLFSRRFQQTFPFWLVRLFSSRHYSSVHVSSTTKAILTIYTSYERASRIPQKWVCWWPFLDFLTFLNWKSL